MANSDMTPDNSSVSFGSTDNTAMQWAQIQLNKLENELHQIEFRLNQLDKSSTIHERDIADLKQTLNSRFDKLEAFLEKSALKSANDLQQLETRINSAFGKSAESLEKLDSKLTSALDKNSEKLSSSLDKLEVRLTKTLDEHKAELKSLSNLTNKYVGGLAVLVFVITAIAAYLRFFAG